MLKTCFGGFFPVLVYVLERIYQNLFGWLPNTRDQRFCFFSLLSKGLKEFHEECLSSHNEYRIRHGAPPLHWSAELAWEAQQWAENLAQTGELRHNEDDTVGENLAGMTGGELSGREAVDMWYEEIENYNFDCHGYGEDTSNFTQVWLIWSVEEFLINFSGILFLIINRCFRLKPSVFISEDCLVVIHYHVTNVVELIVLVETSVNN